jgi:hypothetical protein
MVSLIVATFKCAASVRWIDAASNFISCNLQPGVNAGKSLGRDTPRLTHCVFPTICETGCLAASHAASQGAFAAGTGGVAVRRGRRDRLSLRT